MGAHDRQDQPGQLMPAEKIRVELRAQSFDRQVLERADLTITAVIEQRVAAAVGHGHGAVEELSDAGGVRVIETEGLKPASA
jgi:hypothetical protein